MEDMFFFRVAPGVRAALLVNHNNEYVYTGGFLSARPELRNSRSFSRHI